MLMIKSKELKFSIIFLIVISLWTFIIVYYYNNELLEIRQDYENRILVLNKNLVESINNLRQDTEKEIFAMHTNLSLQLDLTESNLKKFRKQNEEEINALNNIIDQIEKQSNIQLKEIKQQLSSIKVKSEDFSSIIDEVIESVVSIGTDRGQGSGVIFTSDGFIATNFHVVDKAKLIKVLTYDGKIHDAKFIGYNDILDLAVLKIDGNFNELEFGNSNGVRVGEKVIALGNPAGLSFTVTEGIVSAVHRKGPNNLDIYLQTDVSINPGNSGGPLVNAESKIIGINNFKISGFEGLGFAIESNTASEFVNDIVEQYTQVQQ